MMVSQRDGASLRPLTLEPLNSSQYRQVAEWEFGEQGENVDWSRYAAEMNAPQWMHFGVYSGADFVGCISLEKISYNMAAYHVVTARKRVHPQALAGALLTSAGYLFKEGFTAVVADIPIDKRAAARLAIRCHMKEWGHTPTMRYFILTRQRFQRI
jgi:hypothetical protein